MVSIIILSLLCLRGMAVILTVAILAVILAAVIMEEKVKTPKASAC